MTFQPVFSGQDRDGQFHGLGVSHIDFKLITSDSGLFVLENIFHAPGGPARHLHHAQDEFFYILEGEFSFEVGQEKYTLKAGDSLCGPRGVPHAFAFTGPATGRVLITFSPAGKMEAFFRLVTQANAMPALDPQLWSDHGMQLLGPPLVLK